MLFKGKKIMQRSKIHFSKKKKNKIHAFYKTREQTQNTSKIKASHNMKSLIY